MTIYNRNKENNLIRDYRPNLEQLFDQLDITEQTRKDYISRLPIISDFLKRSGLSHNTYLFFKKYLAERNDLSASSKNKYLAVARILLKELHRQGYLPVDITSGVKQFKIHRKHKRSGLNEIEAIQLSSYLSSLFDTPQNARIRAIIGLLVFQGLRTIEAHRLNVEDINFHEKKIYVQGKGYFDSESVPMHPQTSALLQKYLDTFKVKSGVLFFSISNGSHNKRLSTRGIRMIVKNIFKKVGIDRFVHGTRHYFVTTLIREYKGDLTKVMKFSRHKSISTLVVYNDDLDVEKDLPIYYSSFNDLAFCC